MKYKHDSTPYEHTCQRCGRYQEVYEYATDPSFDVGYVEELIEDGRCGLECQIVVDLDKHFKCVACGDVTYFDDCTVDTGKEVTVFTDDDEYVEISRLARLAKRKFRKENDVENYL